MACFEIEVSLEISAAHALRDYDGPCANTHGHNWWVTVYAQCSELTETGFSLDFKLLKKATKFVLDELDHQNLNEIEPFTRLNPTAENLARWLYEQIDLKLKHVLAESSPLLACQKVGLSAVRVQETSRCAVVYRP